VLGVFSSAANSATLLASQLYAPYGASRYGTGTVSPYTNKGFTGQYNDPTSGLDYYGARYYDPVVGLFVSADKKLGNVQGADPYEYVGSNPETYNDPTGEMYAPRPTGGEGGPTPQQLNDDATTYTQHTAPSSGYIGSTLPWLVYLFLYNHQAWSALEGQAQNQGYSLQPLLSQQAADYLDFTSDFNWNANNALRALYAQLRTLAVMHLVQTLGDSGLEGHPDLLSSEEALQTTLTNSEDALAGGCSFTAKTLVSTAQGKEPIGKLHVGEKVLAYNPNTKKMEYQPILHVFLDHDNDLVDVTLTTAQRVQHGRSVSRQSEVIHTNKKHPFFTKERGFLPVGQIKLGMHVLRADGTYGVVTGWKVVAGTQVMYNLEVAQDHTFTVGSGEWVVHNSCIVQDARSSNTFNDAMRQEVQPTLDRIEQGISDPHPNDGTPFANRDGDLPAQSPNYYTEFVHHPSGVINIPGDISRGPAGAQRIIIGNEGEVYYAPYHYRFVIYRLY